MKIGLIILLILLPPRAHSIQFLSCSPEAWARLNSPSPRLDDLEAFLAEAAKNRSVVGKEEALVFNKQLQLLLGEKVKKFYLIQFLRALNPLLGKQAHLLSAENQELIENLLRSYSSKFKPEELLVVGKTLVAFPRHPRPETLAAWSTQLSASLPELRTASLVDVPWVFARLDYPPPVDLLDRIMARLQERLPSLNPDATSQLLWSMTLLSPERLPQLLSAIPPLATPSEKTSQRLQFVISYAQHVLKIPNLPKLSLTNRPQRFSQITDFQRQVEHRLASAGLQVKVEHLIPELQSPVDIYLPDQKIIVELDGPQHYHLLENGEQRLRLGEQRRDEILQGLGFQVVRIPNSQWASGADRVLELARAVSGSRD